MRKKICLTLLWFIQLNFVLAQKQTIDSLKEILRSTKADSSKCLVMAKLCATYGYENPDSALKIGEEGLQIAKSIRFAKGEVACLNEIADIFSQTDIFDLITHYDE